MAVEVIHGSCHCGAVKWQFEGSPESATACNCTVCRRYGVLWAHDHEGEGIARIPINHFDGLDKFEDLPRDGRCVADYWF